MCLIKSMRLIASSALTTSVYSMCLTASSAASTVCPASFAKNYRKRNYVERVHIEENQDLCHSLVPSCIRINAIIGSVQQKENMEGMATKSSGMFYV